jgi:hypothetical protein
MDRDQFHAPAALSLWKHSTLLTGQNVVWASENVHIGREQKTLFLPRIEALSITQPVARSLCK